MSLICLPIKFFGSVGREDHPKILLPLALFYQIHSLCLKFIGGGQCDLLGIGSWGTGIDGTRS